MGRGKTRKSNPSVFDQNLPAHSHCTCGHDHDPPRAADGHNVEGWTDEDIRIYNELLTERAKLEKEKNELEQKSARHQAERALLNEDAAAFDNLFKAQLDGQYKFTGSSPCCLDFVESPAGSKRTCHHEICTRGKTQGVSWMELDTIKYYQTRITSERSTRIKNALRKQRDVELERVKKDDEEEVAQRTRRTALGDKSLPNGHLSATNIGNNLQSPLQGFSTNPQHPTTTKSGVPSTNEQRPALLDVQPIKERIRQDAIDGRLSAVEAHAKLDHIDQHYGSYGLRDRAFQDNALATLSSQDFLPASLSDALSKSLAGTSKDAFSQALDVMKGLFSASDPREVQSAITNLRNVLQLNNPSSPLLRKSFENLEDILNKNTAKSLSIEVKGQNGIHDAAHSLDDIHLPSAGAQNNMNSLKQLAKDLGISEANLLDGTVGSPSLSAVIDGALKILGQSDASDYKANYEKMKQLRDMAFQNIKQLTADLQRDIDTAIVQLLVNHVCGDLLKRAQTGSTDNELRARITTATLILAEKNPNLFQHRLAQLAVRIRGFPSFISLGGGALSDALDFVTARFAESDRQRHAKSVADPLFNTAVPTAGAPSNPLRASAMVLGAMIEQIQKYPGAYTPEHMVPLWFPRGPPPPEDFELLKNSARELLQQVITGREDNSFIDRLYEQVAAVKRRQLERQGGGVESHNATASAKLSKFQEELSRSASELSSISQEAGGSSHPPPYTGTDDRHAAGAHVAADPARPSAPAKSATHTKTTSTTTAATASSPKRKEVIKRQMTTFRNSIDRLKTTTHPPQALGKDGFGLRPAFEGIVSAIEKQRREHEAMARGLARANGWEDLEDWVVKTSRE